MIPYQLFLLHLIPIDFFLFVLDIVRCFVALYPLNDICLLLLLRDFILMSNNNFHCLVRHYSMDALAWLGIYFIKSIQNKFFSMKFFFFVASQLCVGFYQKQKAVHLKTLNFIIMNLHAALLILKYEKFKIFRNLIRSIVMNVSCRLQFSSEKMFHEIKCWHYHAFSYLN